MKSRLPAVTIVLSVANLLVLALLHVLRTDVDPVARPTSDYAHGSYGWLIVFATVGVGLAAIALAVAVRPEVRGTAGQIGVGMLVFFGVAKIVQVFFPIDAAGQVTSAGVGAQHPGQRRLLHSAAGGGLHLRRAAGPLVDRPGGGPRSWPRRWS